MIRTVFTNVLIFVLVTKSYSYYFLGPANIRVERLEKCGEDALGVRFDYFRHRINRTSFATILNLTLPFDIDDTISMNVTASKWGDGGWKRNAFDYHDPNFCTFLLNKFGFFTHQVMDVYDLEHKCPIPSGFYTIDNFEFDGASNYPYLYGKFEVDITLIKDNVVFLCLRQIMVTTPKPLY